MKCEQTGNNNLAPQDGKIWDRPQVIPLPAWTQDEPEPVRLISGTGWKLCRSLQDAAWVKGPEKGASVWEDTVVPMQQETPSLEKYAYAYELEIPAEWTERRIFLRFDGVCCEAEVFVDGKRMGAHYGGFVSWDCEITEAVTAGKKHWLVVGVRDEPQEICPFHFGGLIRDVFLVCLPKIFVSRFHGEVSFDAHYRDACLTVYAGLQGGGGRLFLTLTDPDGRMLPLGEAELTKGEDWSGSFSVSAPVKWDSEHPNLYTLTAQLADGDAVTETTRRRIGFRQIEKRGKEIFVNGDRLKLRGVNRHDIHPVSGRALTHELVEQDVRLFREANVNFIRTSHYPPRPDFLDLCDEYGIYVEDETAVAFLGQEVDCWENDPKFTAKFMNQFAEMIERDRSHPCVILWSLANESIWGRNLAMENAYAHQEDPGRLTIFSYPITQHEDDERADIWSMHYAAWEQDPASLVDSFDRSRHEPADWPVLHDESTHIPCYDRKDQRRDIGVRDFWGETISRFWDRLWEADGVLGCAVWAGIDEVRLNRSRGTMQGPQWGILDGWRRKKPEFWHMRKAYSPIRVKETPETEENGLRFAVENRFNHTNLRETMISWRILEKTGGVKAEGSMAGPDVVPREKGTFVIPSVCPPEHILEISFSDARNCCVEEIAYRPDDEEAELPQAAAGAPLVEHDEKEVLLKGEHFLLRFSKETGLITEGSVDGRAVLTGGPWLHLTGLALAPWELEEMETRTEEAYAAVCMTGHYGRVRVRFTVRADRTGMMETEYELLDMPYASPRKLAMRVGDDTDSGGYEEVGIFFTVPGEMDLLSWKRQGLWSVYPQWHIGRTEGKAFRHGIQSNALASGDTDQSGTKTAGDREWRLDERDPVLFGKYDAGRRGTRDFSSMKFNIRYAAVQRSGSKEAFCVLSDGSDSVRVKTGHSPDHIIGCRDARVVYQGSWTEQKTGYGSLSGTEMWSDTAGDTCTCRFYGTGCAWISSMDILGGRAIVCVDGRLMDDGIFLGVKLPTPGIARGYEKETGRLVYSIEGLDEGEHTLEIAVAGERTPGSSGAYVFVDHFLVSGEGECGDTQMIIDQAWNYPELSWGCYTKEPVRITTGSKGIVHTRLSKC